MRFSWNFTESLDDLAQQYRRMGGDVREVVKEAIGIGQKQLLALYKIGLERHKDTGAAIDSLDIKPIQEDGNEISGEVGSYMEKNELGYYHAKYQEYGAFKRDGGNTGTRFFSRPTGKITFVADPWKRPADAEYSKGFRKLVRHLLRERMGL